MSDSKTGAVDLVYWGHVFNFEIEQKSTKSTGIYEYLTFSRSSIAIFGFLWIPCLETNHKPWKDLCSFRVICWFHQIGNRLQLHKNVLLWTIFWSSDQWKTHPTLPKHKFQIETFSTFSQSTAFWSGAKWVPRLDSSSRNYQKLPLDFSPTTIFNWIKQIWGDIYQKYFLG